MSALAVSLIACLTMLGGAFVGVLLHRSLPKHHLSDQSKDIVRLGFALVATLSALVLSMLITSAKHTFDTQGNEVRQITAKLILLDSQLKRYGPEAQPTSELHRRAMIPMIERIWGERSAKSPTGYRPSAEADLVYAAIEGLSPQSDLQRGLRHQALQTTTEITAARVLLFEQSDDGLPPPLLVVLVFWLTILFASFTLFSPINPTAGAALLIIALSASGAIFLILEMNTPFSGLMQIPIAPVRQALGTL